MAGYKTIENGIRNTKGTPDHTIKWKAPLKGRLIFWNIPQKEYKREIIRNKTKKPKKPYNIKLNGFHVNITNISLIKFVKTKWETKQSNTLLNLKW